ncbi:hypothetical protein [Mucilaginibacter gotjawali]|uniref:Aerotolerance regulator N-terminal domain-containing protein n=1 Tax=Mucilaginibacter gotjawali TaxID=1550579 RepID=A0A839SID4_9SPHI|nr:hypothetical protein [Mucilaginibacter gotjawali]MBB3057053.1 hypothetical protein [Mucilaginibacter gotjawali]
MKNLEYLIYCIPVIFILLSRKYLLKYRKLRNTGKIPYIISAKQRKNVYFYLAILSVVAILIIQIQFF